MECRLAGWSFLQELQTQLQESLINNSFQQRISSLMWHTPIQNKSCMLLSLLGLGLLGCSSVAHHMRNDRAFKAGAVIVLGKEKLHQ